MATLPPTRRIVTGHSSVGKAIFESDTLLHPVDLRSRPAATSPASQLPDKAGVEPVQSKSGGGFTLVYRTEGFPAKTQGSWTDYHGKSIPLSDQQATTVRYVDMNPHQSSPMHRTPSLDIGIVLIGEVVLELDDGIETVMTAGDTVVQRATAHRWHNRTDKMARVAFVLIPGEKVVIDGAVLEPYFALDHHKSGLNQETRG